jgi:beta-glucanase (GH16 family)
MISGNWNRVFIDKFDIGTVNRQVWSVRNTEYKEGTTQTKGGWEGVDIIDGKLNLSIVPNPNEPGKYICGHIGTQQSFQFTYGYVEARIKVHPYPGAHCSLWLQGDGGYLPGNTEIDVMEFFGAKNPARRIGTDVHQNLYMGIDGKATNVFHDSVNDVAWWGPNYPTKRWSNQWVRYGCLWEESGYKFYINDHLVHETNDGLTAKPKFVVLSMISRDYEVVKLNSATLSEQRMLTDWVKVWQRK